MQEYGQVDWFSKKLGFGYINRKDKPDIFVHYTDIEAPGVDKRYLNPGDVVEFAAKLVNHKGKMKWQACNVIVVNSKGGENEAVS